jgi:hypothetical protein
MKLTIESNDLPVIMFPDGEFRRCLGFCRSGHRPIYAVDYECMRSMGEMSIDLEHKLVMGINPVTIIGPDSTEELFGYVICNKGKSIDIGCIEWMGDAEAGRNDITSFHIMAEVIADFARTERVGTVATAEQKSRMAEEESQGHAHAKLVSLQGDLEHALDETRASKEKSVADLESILKCVQHHLVNSRRELTSAGNLNGGQDKFTVDEMARELADLWAKLTQKTSVKSQAGLAYDNFHTLAYKANQRGIGIQQLIDTLSNVMQDPVYSHQNCWAIAAEMERKMDLKGKGK